MNKKIKINNNLELNKFLKYFRIYHILNYHNQLSINIKYDITKENREVVEALINAHNIKDKNKRLEYVYDTACDYIDNNYVNKNYCEFIDNVCLYQRSHPKSKIKINGCCHTCKYLNHGCTIKSLADKLFFCPYIRVKKKCPKLNDILILKYFLNIKQKFIIKSAIYHTKEESLKELRRKSVLIWCFKSIKKNT